MRVKRGVVARRRRKKILKRAKGYYSAGSRCFITAIERSDRALAYAYRDRRQRRREFRKLWIQRINAATRQNGTNYSLFMGALAKSKVCLNRKTLADLAVHDKTAFSILVQQVTSTS